MKKNTLTLTLLILSINCFACTIFSAIQNGKVLVGNNEDFYPDFRLYMRVHATETNAYGYFDIVYRDTSTTGFPQGGMNEKGLFFDFNSVPYSIYKDKEKRIDFDKMYGVFNYMMQHCSTVADAIRLFKKYKIPSLETSQMHLADAQGNFAIIVADSVVMCKSWFQVSTNFNVCHPLPEGTDDKGLSCWRFSKAENMLKENGVTIENFRNILDTTSNTKIPATIYSDIFDLKTGDIYFSYFRDFKHEIKFNIKTLIAKGTHTYSLNDLFANIPIVKVWNASQINIDNGLKTYRELKPTIDNTYAVLMLRYLWSAYLFTEHENNLAQILFDELWNNSPKHTSGGFYNKGTLALMTGNIEEAKTDFATSLQMNISPQTQSILDRLNNTSKDSTNTRFFLPGHLEAKSVCVYNIELYYIPYFLIKTPTGWEGNFLLDAGEYKYIFLVDNKFIIDPNNKNIVEEHTDEGIMTMNKLVVK